MAAKRPAPIATVGFPNATCAITAVKGASTLEQTIVNILATLSSEPKRLNTPASASGKPTGQEGIRWRKTKSGSPIPGTRYSPVSKRCLPASTSSNESSARLWVGATSQRSSAAARNRADTCQPLRRGMMAGKALDGFEKVMERLNHVVDRFVG